MKVTIEIFQKVFRKSYRQPEIKRRRKLERRKRKERKKLKRPRQRKKDKEKRLSLGSYLK